MSRNEAKQSESKKPCYQAGTDQIDECLEGTPEGRRDCTVLIEGGCWEGCQEGKTAHEEYTRQRAAAEAVLNERAIAALERVLEYREYVQAADDPIERDVVPARFILRELTALRGKGER